MITPSLLQLPVIASNQRDQRRPVREQQSDRLPPRFRSLKIQNINVTEQINSRQITKNRHAQHNKFLSSQQMAQMQSVDVSPGHYEFQDPGLNNSTLKK